MANFHNAPRPVDDPEHPRRENEPRDEIEMFIRDAYAAGCAAARNPGGALVAFEYANIHAPKLRALLTPSPDHANAGKSVEGDGWQTIESAPKDGTEFQAWIAKYGWEPRCRINSDTEAFEIYGRVDYDQDGWEVYPHMTPTHWRSPPTPPAGEVA